jgi:hypothetical protein
MNTELTRRNKALESLLEAGKKALIVGDQRAAHDYWRMAAVTSPYEERVWVALMDVLTDEEDREVCLENIIAINPLNPEARRQLRAVRRAQRPIDEDDQAATIPAPLPARAAFVPSAVLSEAPRPRRSVSVAILIGIGIGVGAVLLAVIVSIVVYGGLIITGVP